MDARRGEADEHVPLPHPGAVDDLLPVHDAHGEAGDVVIVRVHDAGVLGGLAADEGAAGPDAALRNAGDDGGHLLRLVFANGDVVQEEEGLCPAAHDVVDAHGHTVDADGVVPVQQLGQTQLSAHAVGAGDQNGFLHAGKVRGEQPAEAADAGDHAGNPGPGHVLFHQFHAFVSGLNVHTGGGVGGGMGVIHASFSFQYLHWLIRFPPSPCFSS